MQIYLVSHTKYRFGSGNYGLEMEIQVLEVGHSIFTRTLECLPEFFYVINARPNCMARVMPFMRVTRVHLTGTGLANKRLALQQNSKQALSYDTGNQYTYHKTCHTHI